MPAVHKPHDLRDRMPFGDGDQTLRHFEALPVWRERTMRRQIVDG